MKNIFEGFEATLTAAGAHTPLDRPPAICFLDLTGYTRVTEERGDEAAADLAARLAPAVQAHPGDPNGPVLTWLGDACDHDAAVHVQVLNGDCVLSLATHEKVG